jgi:hypothetical protein
MTRAARLVVVAVVGVSCVVGLSCADESSDERAASTTSVPAPAPPDPDARCPTQAQVDDLNARTGVAGQTAGSYAAAMQSAVDEVASYLPPDRAADFQVMAASLAGYLRVLTEVGDRSADQMTPDEERRVGEAIAAMRAPEVEAAAKRVGDYFAANCPGIDFSSSGP